MLSDRYEDHPPGHGHRPGPGQAVYGISVAAELAGMGTHSLRLYEQHGLVTPARSAGGTRRYSDDDLARLARIAALTAQGVNLAAIARILDLEDANTELRHTNAALTAERERLHHNPQ
ncbi:MerR family transcriptional regulator [Nocardia sp. NBC_00565]|uniref:MerR family transcriptional regulator n=1 Tax=Nocardia sp. NBC_00565 TaxID=2975993 RepID=UPI002E81BD23|nr:MerR family transcriptional regulator [Nocardia sp. NBC_00565]WUC00175.1 MerR family transcriptional regulator [Nocardia sp. NBC_00565]